MASVTTRWTVYVILHSVVMGGHICCVVLVTGSRTVEHRIVSRVCMTKGATCPFAVVTSRIDWEIFSVMRRILGAAPSRNHGVTSQACLREVGGLVTWICRCIERRLMAAPAIRRHRRIVAAHVTGRAGHGGVRSGQRELLKSNVIESRTRPIGCTVTRRTIRRESQQVIRHNSTFCCCGIKFRLMARDTSRWQCRVLTTRMALRASRRQMQPGQWELIL